MSEITQIIFLITPKLGKLIITTQMLVCSSHIASQYSAKAVWTNFMVLYLPFLLFVELNRLSSYEQMQKRAGLTTPINQF